MKRIEMILRRAKLDELKDALFEAGIAGMTVADVSVAGGASGRRMVYFGSSYDVDFAPKVRAMIVVHDATVSSILAVLEQSIADAQEDDISVLIFDVVEAVRIRTGERGEKVIDGAGPRLVLGAGAVGEAASRQPRLAVGAPRAYEREAASRGPGARPTGSRRPG